MKKLSRKRMVIGIIILFIGASVVPSINGDIEQFGNILDMNEVEDYIGYIGNQEILLENGPEEEWNKTYGGELNDFFRSGIQLENGNYILNGVYGVTEYNTEGDWWLVCIDSIGELLWDKTFGASGYCNGILLAPDGGYVIVGNTDNQGSGGMDILLVKTDENGNIEWSQTYGGSDNESPHNIQMTDDGGYIITGWTESYGDKSGDLWLIKTDSTGNEEWSKTFGGTGIDGGDHIILLEGRGYMFIGVTTSFGAGGFDVWLIKTDSYGNEIWSDTLGGVYDDFINDVKKTVDGGYILVGNSQFSENDGDIWLLKFDSEWNLEWEQIIGDEEYNELACGIQQTSDNGFIITGSHRSMFITGNQQGILLKVDFNGAEEWRKLFGGSEEDWGNDILIISDGGYIVFGYSVSYGAGYKDGWVVKFSSYENQRPNKPSRPSGPSSGNINEEYTFSTSTIDPDGDEIFYLFDWGDGHTSFWYGPYDSGEECSASNIWFERGTFEVRVKAQDVHGGESEWSDPLIVSMPKNHAIYNNIISRLLELFRYRFRFFSLILNDLEVN